MIEIDQSLCWLRADGSQFNKEVYPALYRVLGYDRLPNPPSLCRFRIKAWEDGTNLPIGFLLVVHQSSRRKQSMLTQDAVSIQIKTLLETTIIQALNNAPDAIENMVKAALAQPVDSSGDPKGYGTKMPYLDFLVGVEIRTAARRAVEKVIQEKMPDIEAAVRAGLSSDSVVAAVTKSLVGAASEDWKIEVNFKALG